jgi:hypothetical protein
LDIAQVKLRQARCRRLIYKASKFRACRVERTESEAEVVVQTGSAFFVGYE